MKYLKANLSVLLFLVACANNKIAQTESTPAETPKQNVTIQFNAKVGTAAFDCATANYSNIGTSNSTLVPKDFRFYVHDVRFVKADGSEVAVTLTEDKAYQYQNLALLDFENGTGQCAAQGNAGTNKTVRGTISAGEALTFTKIRFKLGVPQNLNQSGITQPAPLNVTYMFWSWTTGYKHVVVEFNGGTFNPFFAHLGSIDCDTFASPPDIICSTSNRPEIELSYTYGQTVVADAKQLLKDTNFAVTDQGIQPGCHSDRSDPECKVLLNNWGANFSYTGALNAVYTLAASTPASPTQYNTPGQVFFRVE